LEPEKESASPPRISLWPLALLGTLLFALLSSKRNRSGECVSPHDNPRVKGIFAPRERLAVPQIQPTPTQGTNANGRKDDTPPWKKRAEIAIAIGTVGLLIVNIFQMRSTQKASETADKTFKLTFRPRVEILSVGPHREMVNGEIVNHLDEGRLMVQVGYTNRGPFAARNVRIFVYDRIGTQAMRGTYSKEPRVFPDIPPMGPEQIPNTYIAGENRRSEAEMDGLRKGTLRATFSVLVVYDDDLGKETHHAEYCDVFTLQPYNDICPWPVHND
jgi:hypothetical protein